MMKNKKRKRALGALEISILLLLGSLLSVPLQAGNGTPEDPPIQTDYWALLLAGSFYDINFPEGARQFAAFLSLEGWNATHIQVLVQNQDYFPDGFTWLRENADSNDIILVYLVGHGDETGAAGLAYSEFDQQLDQITYKGALLIIDACQSGSAIPYLQQENRVILTSCGAGEPTMGFHYAHYCGLTLAADCLGNKNGKVSEGELYNYILFDPDLSGNPQFKDDYPGDITITSFNLSRNGFFDQYLLKDSFRDSWFTSGWISISDEPGCITHARQSVTLTNHTLSKLMLKMMLNHSDIVTARVYNQFGICCAEKTSNFTFTAPWKFWYTFDFPDMPVTPGETYEIVCSVETTSEIWWWGTTADTYLNGEAAISYDGGTSWGPGALSDLTFITSGFDYTSTYHPPYIPKAPSGPIRGLIGEEYDYECYGIDPDGDPVYLFFDWGDNTNSDWLGPYPSGETATASHAWDSSGRYEVKVKARDIDGNISDWSTVYVHINPPNKPSTPIGPTIGETGFEYSYQTHTSDPDGNQVFYLWDWGDGTPSDWLGPYASGETITMSHIWYIPGNYSIRVKAKDTYEAESDWSDSLNIFLHNSPPETPDEPSGPTDGKINIEYTYNTSTIDPNSDDVYYKWDWGDGTQDPWRGPYHSCETTSGTHTWTRRGTYTIKVKAKDIYGAESDWAALTVKMPTEYSTCFLAGTQVLMADDSLIKIEDVQIGAFVKSYDIATNKIVSGKVTNVYHHVKDEMVAGYVVINGYLQVTPNHPIFVNGKWKEAGSIKPGDDILQIDNGRTCIAVPVQSIKTASQLVPTYNLEVETYHSYIANGIVVSDKLISTLVEEYNVL